MSDIERGFSVGVLGGFVFGAILSVGIVTHHWKDEAIERGYGLHCPDDGKFAWVGECEE